MRFTLIKNLKKDTSMRWVLNLLLVFTSVYILLNIYLNSINFGISVPAITATLFGNEEEFLDPIADMVFLEFIHTEIFFIMMLLLTLSAVFIRLFTNSKMSLIILNITMISALVSLISLALSFYLSQSFIVVYLISFFTWHFFSFYMSVSSLWKLNA